MDNPGEPVAKTKKRKGRPKCANKSLLAAHHLFLNTEANTTFDDDEAVLIEGKKITKCPKSNNRHFDLSWPPALGFPVPINHLHRSIPNKKENQQLL